MIKSIREVDTSNKLTIVANGIRNQGVQTHEEYQLYTKAGANACSLYTNIFTQGPFVVENLLN